MKVGKFALGLCIWYLYEPSQILVLPHFITENCLFGGTYCSFTPYGKTWQGLNQGSKLRKLLNFLVTKALKKQFKKIQKSILRLNLGLTHNRFGGFGSRTLKNNKKSIIQSYM
jgi:hypothetical protein